MKVELPTKFDIEYPQRNLKYYAAYSKPKIAKILFTSCRGYCMYCGKTVKVEGDRIFHLEHSVDKKGNVNQEMDPNNVLEHCKFNLAIACTNCNTVCKKMVDKIDLKKFSPLPSCPSICSDMCEKYSSIRKEYMTKNAIILQPRGVQEPIPYLISYDLLKHIYVPTVTDEQDDVLFFIQNHIDRFELNGERFSTCIIEICSRLVILYESGIEEFSRLIYVLNSEPHLNVLEEKFIEFIQKYFSEKSVESLVDFCKLLVVLDAVP